MKLLGVDYEETSRVEMVRQSLLVFCSSELEDKAILKKDKEKK
jgi:hypothetical protein